MLNGRGRLPRVYLAGKIGKNDWRHGIVPHLRSVTPYPYGDEPGEWPEVGDDGHWFPLEVDGFEYQGPYFMGCDHGCGHGPDGHGIGIDEAGCIPASPNRRQVVRWCRHWLESADVLFCWFDDLTAYGTLAELGYFAALGRPIFLAVRIDEDDGDPVSTWRDVWFATELATARTGVPDADTAWRKFVAWWRLKMASYWILRQSDLAEGRPRCPTHRHSSSNWR